MLGSVAGVAGVAGVEVVVVVVVDYAVASGTSVLAPELGLGVDALEGIRAFQRTQLIPSRIVILLGDP